MLRIVVKINNIKKKLMFTNDISQVIHRQIKTTLK